MKSPESESIGQRSSRFNETTGAHGYISVAGRTGGNHHPDRCICQGEDSTPHKHYSEAPFRCARCGCPGYTPAIEPPVTDSTPRDAGLEADYDIAMRAIGSGNMNGGAAVVGLGKAARDERDALRAAARTVIRYWKGGCGGTTVVLPWTNTSMR